MSEELTLDDRRKASNHVQVTLVIALRESQLVVLLGAHVTFINTWWHVANDVYLVGTMSKRIRFI